MKRIDIDKPAVAQVAPGTETAPSTWSDAWNEQLNRSVGVYGRLFAAMRDDFAGLVQKRIEADLDIARCWGACRNMTDALELQQKWLQGAIEHYTQHGQRMAELCQTVMSQPSETTGSADSASPKVVDERKTASGHPEAGDRRAA